jgi:hypothetical protein
MDLDDIAFGVGLLCVLGALGVGVYYVQEGEAAKAQIWALVGIGLALVNLCFVIRSGRH